MAPWQLAKDSESSHQIALFCWAAKAQRFGFKSANDVNSYKSAINFSEIADCVPELAWLYHIPNGGSRGDSAKSRAVAGGQLKAEGVKSGVWDIFWPFPMHHDHVQDYCGLYIEMKRPAEKLTKSGGLSASQVEFGNFAHSQGYCVKVCYSWLEAAEVIQAYYEGAL